MKTYPQDSTVHNKAMVIPPDLEEHDLAGYLEDIYHEYATESHPSVRRLD
ncbi:MAG: hypothetical protein JW765_00405 [Deltaproteobacteria bacterium]|nr:hypothetical protein [Candidatus Zymogenaceae bacterium]